MRLLRPGWLVALALLAWFAPLGYRDLIHPDEGRYAELARQMLVSGDWVTPRLNGILYFEKPALPYWAGAIAFWLFGVNEFAARLWPGLAGAGAVLVLWWTSRRAMGERLAMYAAAVLGSCFWWLGNGHFLNLDMSLSAALTLTLCGFWLAQRDAATPAENRWGMRAAWVGMALAVLSKGLIGVVLPGAVLVAYSLVARDLTVWRRMRWLSGLALFALVAVPWFVLVSQRNPEFARFFFIHEHVERFLTTSHRRTGPWWYFVPLLLAGLVPWTTLLPGALRAAWRRQPGRFQPNRLMLCWAVVIFLFFSASGSKLPSYILPMFPALAVLIALHLNRLPAHRVATHALLMGVVALLALVALQVITRVAWPGRPPFAAPVLAYRDWIVVGLMLIGALALIAWWLAQRARVAPAVVALAFSGLLGSQVILQGHQTLSLEKSARTLVSRLKPALPADAPVFTVAHHDQTLPVYLGRPVVLVNWLDEFATGLRIEPHRALPTEAQFATLWRELPAAGAVFKPDGYERWRAAGLPMREVYRDGERVVVVKPPAASGAQDTPARRE